MNFFSTLGNYLLMLKGMFTKPENIKMYWKELMHQCVEIGIGSLGIVFTGPICSVIVSQTMSTGASIASSLIISSAASTPTFTVAAITPTW